MCKILKEKDPVLYKLIKKEKHRQTFTLNLIASENVILPSVQDCLNSCLTNKYSEGYYNRRYYAGTKYIDQIEKLAIDRCISGFDLNPDLWDANVQCYSGSIANFAIYNALCKPGDKIMGLNLPDGGHLSHGYRTRNKCISATSKYFLSLSYNVDKNGFIDYDDLEKKAIINKPKIIIAGTSAYSQLIDYKKIKTICEKIDCYLLADISHIAGFIVTGLIPSPFNYADVVMTTTHKTLRGPRGAIILYKKELKDKIDYSVFPSMQGGPHNNTIAGICTLMNEVKTPDYKNYQKRVLTNAKLMVKLLKQKKYNILTNKTENHMFLIDLKNKNVNGTQAQFILEECRIICNKNFIYTDTLPCEPSGIRLGLPFITSQNYTKKNIIQICNFINKAIIITQSYALEKNVLTPEILKSIELLKEKVKNFILKKENSIKKITFKKSYDEINYTE